MKKPILSTAPDDAPLQNNILQAAEQKLESGLTPDNREDYLKVVVAGMRTALARGPQGMLARLRQSPDPIKAAADGAVSLVLMLRLQSRNTMPVKAMIPAGATLMFHALDFLDKSGAVKIGVNELAQATRIFGDRIMRAMGMTPQKLTALATKVHAVSQDPAQMDTLAKRTGVVRDPRASLPTPLPPGGDNAA